MRPEPHASGHLPPKFLFHNAAPTHEGCIGSGSDFLTHARGLECGWCDRATPTRIFLKRLHDACDPPFQCSYAAVRSTVQFAHTLVNQRFEPSEITRLRQGPGAGAAPRPASARPVLE